MENRLKDLILNHDGKIADKWTLYVHVWDELFSEFEKKEINLFEIGIQNGGSLELWAKYFQKAKHIIGCDIDNACEKLKFPDQRISVIIGDAKSDEVEQHISELASNLDIVIDDGSHKSGDIIKSFSRYMKYFNSKGLYVIEDLHASYWEEFEGGLHNPYSAISFFKRLLDIINFEHWRSNQSRLDFLSPFINKYDLQLSEFSLCKIHSISFFNSLCIIEFKPSSENSLGERILVGSEEQITVNHQELNGMTIHDIPAKVKNDSHLDIFSLLTEVEEIKNKVSDKDAFVRGMKSEISDYSQTIRELRYFINKQNNNIQKLTADMHEKELSIQLFNYLIDEREQSYKDLLNYISEKETIIKDLNQKIFTQEQAIKNLKLELLTKENDAEIVKTKQNENERNIKALLSQIDNQKKEIISLSEKLEKCEQEILFYSLSKSWQLTRPFRIFLGKIKGNKND
jgi:hypothetical protein